MARQTGISKRLDTIDIGSTVFKGCENVSLNVTEIVFKKKEKTRFEGTRFEQTSLGGQ